MKHISADNIHRVLVIRPDEIGDVVLTSPFLRELRRNLPGAAITLVVRASALNLVELCPYVDEIVTFGRETAGMKDVLCNMAGAVGLGRRLRKTRKYDLAIAPRWDIDLHGAALMAYFSGATYRVGYSAKVNRYKQKFNRGFDRLFSHVVRDDVLRHEVERNLRVIRFLGGEVEEDRLELWLGGEDEQFADRVLQGVNHKVRIAFAPGARQRRREWPLEDVVDVASWCKDRARAQIVVLGGPKDKNTGDALAKNLGNGVVNLAGKTTLRQTAAVLKHCDVFVTNDSGPLHIAAAMGVPVVEISCHPLSGNDAHRHSPTRFGPWKVPHAILQPANPTSPCSATCRAEEAHCIRSIKVEDVQAAIGRLLAEKCGGSGDRRPARHGIAA